VYIEEGDTGGVVVVVEDDAGIESNMLQDVDE
jgi:hypothetical protein